MTSPTPTTIRCANCGNPVEVPLRTVIDVQSDPQGKSLLMSNRLNQARCGNCGHVNQMLAPLLYHDAQKELLLAHIPMEVALQRNQNEEQIIGDLMNRLTSALPKDQFKAYMFNPKRTLTMQGLIDQVMEADGITKDMLETQRKRVELLQQMIDAQTEDDLKQLIEANDAAIDMSFFQTMAAMAQRMAQEGRPDIAGSIVNVQDALLQYSTAGQNMAQQQMAQQQVVQDVAQDIEALGENATRADFRQLALQYAAEAKRSNVEDNKLQALIGLVRPAFDYQFLQEFTQAISEAPAKERDEMEAVRDRIVELSTIIDQQMQQQVAQAAQFLQAVANSPNPAQMLRENADMIDQDFMTVLQANMQEAQRRQDAQTLNRLQQIYEMVMELLRSQMSPELRFLNELLSMDDATAMLQRLNAELQRYQPEDLLDMVDAIEEILQQQGQTMALQQLGIIRAELEKVVS